MSAADAARASRCIMPPRRRARARPVRRPCWGRIIPLAICAVVWTALILSLAA